MSKMDNLKPSSDKKSELKVKLDMLKHNIFEYKKEIEKLGNTQKDISIKYQAAKEIEELRDYQSNSLYEEVKIAKKKRDQLNKTINLLKEEKIENERENAYYEREMKDNLTHKNSIRNYHEELTTNRKLLEKEVQLLKEKYTGQDKNKFNNEKLNSTSQKHFDSINAELSEKNRNIISLQNKIDELVCDVNKYENLLSIENFDNNNTGEFNLVLDKKLLTAKENLRITENKLTAIKLEVDNVKDNLKETKNEREGINRKLENLIEIISAINQTNMQINTLYNFIVNSFNNKAEFMQIDADFLAKYTEMKNKILPLLKEINSYNDPIQNFC